MTSSSSNYLTVWEELNKIDGIFRNPNVSFWKRKFWTDKSTSSSTSSSSSSTTQACAESFIITHNPDHKRMKRPPSTSTSISTAVSIVSRPFNPEAFNFTKASLNEVICLVRLKEGETASFSWFSTLGNDKNKTSLGLTCFPKEDSNEHPIFVNVSPIFKGHGLFVPNIVQGNPQVANTSLLTLGVRLASLFSQVSSDFKCGYNSLSAFASVNHFHLHTIFASSLQPDGISCNLLPCEFAPFGKQLWQTNLSRSEKDTNEKDNEEKEDVVLTCHLHDWIVPGFVYSIQHNKKNKDLEGEKDCTLTETQILAISTAAGRLVERLVQLEIPHHFLITEGGNKVYVWPRKPQVPSFDDRTQMALLECAGVLILNESSAYDETSETKVTIKDLQDEIVENVAQSKSILDTLAKEEQESRREIEMI